MLAQLGEGAKLLAGGQSLIPLMKLRFANPEHLVDLNFIPGTTYIKEEDGALHFGAMTRHAEIENSAIAAASPDSARLRRRNCGRADPQSRHDRRLAGGSRSERRLGYGSAHAEDRVHCLGPRGARTIPLTEFITDAYTTALAHDELVSEVVVKIPRKGSGGAYLAFKRSAPVYPSASAAVQFTMAGEIARKPRLSWAAWD